MISCSCDLMIMISCSCDLMIMISCSCASYSLFTCHTMHARSPCTWSIVPVIPVIVITSVLDTAKHIILMSYLLLLHLYILLFTVLFPSCTLAGPLLTDLNYFLVSRSDSRYRELIVEHILVLLFSGEFYFFSWLVLFRYGGWYCLWFCVSYMWFYPCARLYMHIYVCYPARYW